MAAASLLTLAPLSLLYFLSPERTQHYARNREMDRVLSDDSAADRANQNTSLPSADSEPVRSVKNTFGGPVAGPRQSSTSLAMESTFEATGHSEEPVAEAHGTQVAMLRDSSVSDVGGAFVHSFREPATSASSDLSIAGMSNADLLAEVIPVTKLPAGESRPENNETQKGRSETTTQDLPVLADLLPDSSDATTYYDSTGHIALMDQQPVENKPVDEIVRNLTGKSSEIDRSVDSEQKDVQNGVTSDSRPRSSSRRKSRSEKEAEKDDANAVARAEAAAREGMLQKRQEDASETEDPLLEEVVLQSPVEKRRVNRIENVLAVTKAKGWPVALVRSDLPGDDWWVQQMIGIHGTAFSSRVNFGNEESIPGSAYRLVFVFLDSPDEVRRFRIAKQFSELPEGIRHSREFFFVRQ
ncbi:MAG: hypothetical protein KDA91_07490 [Planctomycetaceae bacterium]|nr:hypothetical protein [Planctomycetaceae bacterium]